MKTEELSLLITNKKSQKDCRQRIEGLFSTMFQRNGANADNLSDFCQEVVPVWITLDLMDIDRLDSSIDKLKSEIKIYKELRKSQSLLEKENNLDNFMKNQIETGMSFI